MKNLSLRIFLSLSACFLANSLHAQGTATLDVIPVLVDFGEIEEGGTGRQNLTLTNLTDETLNVANFAQTGSASFSVDPIGGGKPCGAQTPSLAPNDNCTLEVLYSPEFPEEANGTVTFTPNGDATKAITVRLKGSSPDVSGGGCSLQVPKTRR